VVLLIMGAAASNPNLFAGCLSVVMPHPKHYQHMQYLTYIYKLVGVVRKGARTHKPHRSQARCAGGAELYQVTWSKSRGWGFGKGCWWCSGITVCISRVGLVLGSSSVCWVWWSKVYLALALDDFGACARATNLESAALSHMHKATAFCNHHAAMSCPPNSHIWGSHIRSCCTWY